MADSPANTPADAVGLLSQVLAKLTEASATVAPEGLDALAAATFLGISRSKFHEMNAAGLVPAPVELGDRCPRWLRSELLAWLRAGAPARSRWAGMRDVAMKRAG